MPRCEAACAVCAQKDFLEHRHKLSLFDAVPKERVSEHCADAASDQEDVPEGEANTRPTRTLVKHRRLHYLQSPALVQNLLDVDRYRQQWRSQPAAVSLHGHAVIYRLDASVLRRPAASRWGSCPHRHR